MIAPTQAAMSRAWIAAAVHYRRQYMASPEDGGVIEITVNRVPHLGPGVGRSMDWYKIGSLFVEPLYRLLDVYANATTGAVKLDQTIEDVPTARFSPQEQGKR